MRGSRPAGRSNLPRDDTPRPPDGAFPLVPRPPSSTAGLPRASPCVIPTPGGTPPTASRPARRPRAEPWPPRAGLPRPQRARNDSAGVTAAAVPTVIRHPLCHSDARPLCHPHPPVIPTPGGTPPTASRPARPPRAARMACGRDCHARSGLAMTAPEYGRRRPYCYPGTPSVIPTRGPLCHSDARRNPADGLAPGQTASCRTARPPRAGLPRPQRARNDRPRGTYERGAPVARGASLSLLRAQAIKGTAGPRE